jgi:D-3-phosphoglycerate dehydrogenase
MLLASRDIIGGIKWVVDNKDDENIAKSAEKAKKAFAGHEIDGKKMGVIGLGAIGVRVANAASRLNMDVYGYDPYVSIDSAWNLSRSIHHVKNVDEIFKECDYITIHVPALDSTKGMISKDAIAMMKDDVVVLNFARDILVDEEAMVAALESGHVKHYVTDFATPGIAGVKGAIVLPHLGASTEEAEDNCAKMAVREVRDYLENGNIKNSVNFPNCDMGVKGEYGRIAILHRNVPNMLGQITGIFAKDDMNIEDLTNKSKGGYAYTLIDVSSEITDDVVKDLNAVKEVLRVRVIG